MPFEPMTPRFRRLLAAVLSTVLVQLSTAAFGASVEEAPKDSSWFLARLKQVSDEGAALNPSRVSQLLKLKFERTETEQVKQPADCSNPYFPRSRKVQTYKARDTWYKPTASGIPHMEVPRAFINPPTQLPDPSFEYKITYSTNCTGDYEPTSDVEARIEFSGLPAFGCITAGQISTEMGAEYQLATDGVSLSRYKGKVDDASGSEVEFVFRMGVQCALGATLTQKQNAGYRYLRAEARLKECAAKSDHQFCATRQSMGWADGSGIDQMDRARVAYCGKFATFYANEPLTNQPPPEISSSTIPRVGGPCTGK